MSWYSIMQMQPVVLRERLKIALKDWEEGKENDKKENNTI